MRKLWLALLVFLLQVFSTPLYAQKWTNPLDIDPVLQKTDAWCWLATAEMVFRYYAVPANDPDFQCGEAKALGAVPIPGGWLGGICPGNCKACAGESAGPMAQLALLLAQYPLMMQTVTGNKNSPSLLPPLIAAVVPPQTIKSEIDAGRPLIAGISPSFRLPFPPGLAQHAVLIVGYEQRGNVIILNDPFDWKSEGMTPPYLLAGGRALQPPGQFEISHDALKERLLWNTTIFGITTVPNVGF